MSHWLNEKTNLVDIYSFRNSIKPMKLNFTNNFQKKINFDLYLCWNNIQGTFLRSTKITDSNTLKINLILHQEICGTKIFIAQILWLCPTVPPHLRGYIFDCCKQSLTPLSLPSFHPSILPSFLPSFHPSIHSPRFWTRQTTLTTRRRFWTRQTTLTTRRILL